mmetsp:Transcript_2537/g.4603  ORF Transcript_2537/g.4603 Transcript_2537/m.4603 type:complete len:726 (+) Transcript_2537:233-2410(+)
MGNSNEKCKTSPFEGDQVQSREEEPVQDLVVVSQARGTPPGSLQKVVPHVQKAAAEEEVHDSPLNKLREDKETASGVVSGGDDALGLEEPPANVGVQQLLQGPAGQQEGGSHESESIHDCGMFDIQQEQDEGNGVDVKIPVGDNQVNTAVLQHVPSDEQEESVEQRQRQSFDESLSFPNMLDQQQQHQQVEQSGGERADVRTQADDCSHMSVVSALTEPDPFNIGDGVHSEQSSTLEVAQRVVQAAVLSGGELVVGRHCSPGSSVDRSRTGSGSAEGRFDHLFASQEDGMQQDVWQSALVWSDDEEEEEAGEKLSGSRGAELVERVQSPPPVCQPPSMHPLPGQSRQGPRGSRHTSGPRASTPAVKSNLVSRWGPSRTSTPGISPRPVVDTGRGSESSQQVVLPRETFSLTSFLAKHARCRHHQQHGDDGDAHMEVGRSGRGRTRTLSSEFGVFGEEDSLFDSDKEDGETVVTQLDEKAQAMSIQLKLRQTMYQQQQEQQHIQPTEVAEEVISNVDARLALLQLPATTFIKQRRNTLQQQGRKAKQSNLLIDSLLQLHATESPMPSGRDKVMALLTHVETNEYDDDCSDSDPDSSRRKGLFLSADSSVNSLAMRVNQDGESEEDAEISDEEGDVNVNVDMAVQSKKSDDDLRDFMKAFSKEVEDEYRLVLPYSAFRNAADEDIPLSDEEEPESKHLMYKRQTVQRNEEASKEDEGAGARRVSIAV